MTLQLVESTHAPNRFNTGETFDAADVLGRLGALLDHRAKCRAAIARHSRNSAALARAQWLREHERASAQIAELLPEARQLLTDVSREVAPFDSGQDSPSFITNTDPTT